MGETRGGTGSFSDRAFPGPGLRAVGALTRDRSCPRQPVPLVSSVPPPDHDPVDPAGPRHAVEQAFACTAHLRKVVFVETEGDQGPTSGAYVHEFDLYPCPASGSCCVFAWWSEVESSSPRVRMVSRQPPVDSPFTAVASTLRQ